MNYDISDLENQIIATLQANTDLSGVKVRTHAGEINAQAFDFMNKQMLEGFIHLLPFAYVQYAGRNAEKMSEDWSEWNHILRFRIYIGAKSLRERVEAQHSAYDILAAVYDSLHGRFPLASAQSLAPEVLQLSGTQITTTDFNALSPLWETAGESERLIVNIPSIVVYYTDYSIRLLT